VHSTACHGCAFHAHSIVHCADMFCVLCCISCVLWDCHFPPYGALNVMICRPEEVEQVGAVAAQHQQAVEM
jgi:hypothetical protein